VVRFVSITAAKLSDTARDNNLSRESNHSPAGDLSLVESATRQPKTASFPPGFLWGAATSSHQVEGDNRWNDWWEYEQSGRLPYVSGAACRHYELYQQDFDLARSWGHNAHRFSIEWSRIEPFEGTWNKESLKHYRAVVTALRERGLEPVVTLHHFTNPAWFTRSGGWLRSDSASLFARYVKIVAAELAEVRFWLTINEPTVYVTQGYIHGEWPPQLKASWLKALTAFRNLAGAHVLAYRVLHDTSRDANVGFAHSAAAIMPCSAASSRDRVAARIRDFLLNRAFFSLLGASAKNRGSTARCLDFIGINYYTRALIRSVGWGPRALVGVACHLDHHSDKGVISDTGWEVYPLGLPMILRKLSALGVPMFVTENGIATSNESLRCEFIMRHLECLAEAIEGGLNVIGYLYWTLMDNFEWSLGTNPHFGLAAVDLQTQRRYPRACVEEFRRVCLENRLPIRANG
jgi:beta-glucosidase